MPAERFLSVTPSVFPKGTQAAALTPPSVSSRLNLSLILVCYGPASEINASRIRLHLFDDGAGRPRSILRGAGLYPVPGPPPPALLYEPEGNRWRRRADLEIALRALVEDPASTRNLASAPAVLLRH